MKMKRFPLFDINNEGATTGGGGNPEAQFQQKVLAGVSAVKDQVNVIEGNFKTLDKDAKKLADDFAAHCKTFEGMPSQIGDLTRSIQAMQLKIAAERRASFGSAAERISADADQRNAVNGLIRLNARRFNPNVPITPEQEKAAQDYLRALTGASGSGAAYVTTELIPNIYSVVSEYGIWRNFDVIPLSQSAATMIVDSTDPTMYWTAANTAPTEGTYTSTPVAVPIGKLLGWIQVANELLADSAIDLTGHVLAKFANATAKALDWACTTADGTADATDGGYTGIFYGGTAAVAASGNVSVATLDFEDFLATMLVVDASVLSKPTAGWVLHPQMLVRMIGLKDSNGRPIFLPAGDAPSFGAFGSILGYPVVLSHTAPSTDCTSKKIAVFGDLKGLGVGLRSDFEFAASDQAKFTEDSTTFRARARGAAVVKKATSFGMLTTAAS